ncbi:MAG: ABC transporter substrate-binding protein [Rhodospirillaceae bacterium]|nr:ABC transporter substrate-binding protein [Rhodospirillaceae bacterium]
MDAVPLADRITAAAANCGEPATLQVPTIAWGADMAASLANGNATRTASGSIFADEGLDITLYRQDDFQAQIEDYLACRTPFIRGTMGMLSQAAAVLGRDQRTAPVVVYQLSWSNGGDALVVKDTIRTPADLRGKTIAVQAYGPHVDYLMRILTDAGLTPDDVTIVWTRDLLQIDETSVSPAMALREDPAVDAAFVIIPDALALTSGGTVGTGSEESVRGAHILLSTRTASRVIADVYAVRADYFAAHRDQVMAFVHGLMRAEEQLSGLMRTRSGADYDRMISAAAELLLDASTATDDAVAMYGDAELAGFPQNVAFFTDGANPRGFGRIGPEIQRSMIALGLLSQEVPFTHAEWDYAALAEDLSETEGVERPRFDTDVVQQIVTTRIQQDADSGVLFSFEIYFGPNQNTFPADQYRDAFSQAIELASTYGGAILTIEGHSDPLGYLRQKRDGAAATVLNQIRQSARNLSYSRANAVADSIIAFAAGEGITLDPSQFGIVGLGIGQPNTPQCTYDETGDITLACAPANEQEWNATRRVVFKIVQIEAEAPAFNPL